MDVRRPQTILNSHVWSAYRRAFADLSQKVKIAQGLTADTLHDRCALKAAMAEVDRARAVYNRERDSLAGQLLRIERGTAA